MGYTNKGTYNESIEAATPRPVRMRTDTSRPDVAYKCKPTKYNALTRVSQDKVMILVAVTSMNVIAIPSITQPAEKV